jgi:hypothetical protein
MSSPSRILEEWGDRRFCLEGWGQSEPKRLNPGCSNQIQGPGPSEPKAVIFRGIYWLQLKSGRFSGNLNAESACPIKDSVLGILRYCLRPSIKHTGEKSEADGAQFGVGRVPLAKPRQDASATTEDQQAASGSKE